LILAVAVELAFVPLSALLLLDVRTYRFLPVLVTLMTVPTGILDAARFTVTGFVVDEGSVISGETKEPVGEEGTGIPAIAVNESVGIIEKLTNPGDETVAEGEVAPEKLNVFASRRIRPRPP